MLPHSLEVVVPFSNNRTAHWLQTKSSEEQEELLCKARLCAPEFKKLYRERRCKFQEERTQALQAKQLALLRLQEKAIKEKEKLPNDLLLYGLWQSKSDVSQGLAKLHSKADKLKALKTQLAFRKKVLEQKHPDKDVFHLSKSRKQLTVDEVSRNLIKLIEPSSQVQLVSSSANETLIGKRIRHRWKDPDGNEQWYFGTILSLVAGSTDWFNVSYDGEEEVLCLNLILDIEKGDLEFVDC